MTADHSQYLAALVMRSIAHGQRTAENADATTEAERKAIEDAKSYLSTLELAPSEDDRLSEASHSSLQL